MWTSCSRPFPVLPKSKPLPQGFFRPLPREQDPAARRAGERRAGRRKIRQGASGRARTFDRLAEKFLPGTYDPAGFALRLAHKDVTLALELAKANGVPMRAGEHALAELTEAMQRGWAERDCRVAMELQAERAGVSVRVPPEELKKAV